MQAGGWGKSTLLRLIEDQLPDDPKIIKLRFNAWTAEGANTLEGLIKSVLGGLDSNVLRRSVHRLARQRNVLIISRLASGIAARFLGVPRLVDELWAQMGVDAKSRNEMREASRGDPALTMAADSVGLTHGSPARAGPPGKGLS
jgi:hypothetical protein